MSYLHRTRRRPSRLPSFLWGMVAGLAIGTAVLFLCLNLLGAL